MSLTVTRERRKRNQVVLEKKHEILCKSTVVRTGCENDELERGLKGHVLLGYLQRSSLEWSFCRVIFVISGSLSGVGCERAF